MADEQDTGHDSPTASQAARDPADTPKRSLLRQLRKEPGVPAAVEQLTGGAGLGATSTAPAGARTDYRVEDFPVVHGY